VLQQSFPLSGNSDGAEGSLNEEGKEFGVDECDVDTVRSEGEGVMWSKTPKESAVNQFPTTSVRAGGETVGNSGRIAEGDGVTFSPATIVVNLEDEGSDIMDRSHSGLGYDRKARSSG